MRLGTFPIVAFGVVDPIAGAGWTDFGTPAAASGETDPFGGTDGVIITDNSAVAAEARVRAASYIVNEDFFDWTICLKFSTATATVMEVRDVDAADYPLVLSVAWSGGVPVVTPSATAGNPTPTVICTLAIGGGWYLIKARCPWTPGHSALEELYGASGTAAAQGATRYFLRSMALLDDIASYKRFARSMDGYERAKAPSGVQAIWSYGDEWARRGTVSWVPDEPRNFPIIVSGFKGDPVQPGVNAGVEAMLRAGWQGQIRWVPDRTACTVYQDVDLTLPAKDWEPNLEGNGDQAFAIELVSTAPGRVP